MRLKSRVAPPYLPESDQKTVLRLGLQQLNPDDWLIVDADLPTYHAHKLAARSQNGDKVYRTLPGSQQAQAELFGLVVEHLVKAHPAHYNKDKERLVYLPTGESISLRDRSLWNATLLVGEDICLMSPADDGYRMTAGSVCSPSNWQLEDKIGQSLDVIHGPVPGYDSVLSGRVNRLFDSLKAGKPVYRYNWSIQRGDELLWRYEADHEQDTSLELYWRVERQTLRRMPVTGAVVFTIRIFLHSFTQLRQQPDFSDALSAILARLPDDTMDYKDLQSLQNRI